MNIYFQEFFGVVLPVLCKLQSTGKTTSKILEFNNNLLKKTTFIFIRL